MGAILAGVKPGHKPRHLLRSLSSGRVSSDALARLSELPVTTDTAGAGTLSARGTPGGGARGDDGTGTGGCEALSTGPCGREGTTGSHTGGTGAPGCLSLLPEALPSPAFLCLVSVSPRFLKSSAWGLHPTLNLPPEGENSPRSDPTRGAGQVQGRRSPGAALGA